MRIRKIKVTKDNKITVVYEQMSRSGAQDEYSFTCSDKAAPAFYEAMAALAPHVVKMCELPEDYVERIKVKGVSFSYGGEAEVMGATISAECATMREAMLSVLCDPEGNPCFEGSDGDRDVIMQALSTTAGRDLLERLEKLERAAAASWSYCLAKLEGADDEELDDKANDMMAALGTALNAPNG